MKAYTEVAEVYDEILKHVDYQRWYLYISSLMIKHIDNPRTVLELGCGTGKFGAKFSRDDFKIVGMDISVNMLMVAKLRAFKNFSIVCSDMRNFVFKEKFDFIFSVHDSLNYMTTPEDFKKVIRSVKNVMHSKSVFFFDVTTPYNIKKNFNKKAMQYLIRGNPVEWINQYDKKNKMVYSKLRFLKSDGTSMEENHLQKLYTIKEIKKMLDEEEMEILEILRDYEYKKPNNRTVMINFITRKKQK